MTKSNTKFNEIQNKYRPLTLGIDIGKTAIKMMIMDANGQPLTEYLITMTPHPATQEAVFNVIGHNIELLRHTYDRVSAGFPGVIQNSIIKTASHLPFSWVGIDLQQQLQRITGKPTRVANDADVQGYGDITGKGVELVITLGTGLGSALFLDGRLVPNLELSRHPFIENKTYEELLGKQAVEEFGVNNWNNNLWHAISLWEQTFNYDHLYLGGGNSEKVCLKLPESVTISKNIQGVLGGIALWTNYKDQW